MHYEFWKYSTFKMCKQADPLANSAINYTLTQEKKKSPMKIRWTKICCLRYFVKHCCVRAFEKVNIALDALLVALWLLQAELQVFQTHLELFLSLQTENTGVDTTKAACGPVTAVEALGTHCPFLRETSPCACSGGGASARSPSCSSPPPGWGFYFEGPLLCKQPGLSPCWPGQRGGSRRKVMRQNSSGSRTKPPGMHVELELCCTCCLTSARAASSCLLKAWHSDERWSSCRLL